MYRSVAFGRPLIQSSLLPHGIKPPARPASVAVVVQPDVRIVDFDSDHSTEQYAMKTEPPVSSSNPSLPVGEVHPDVDPSQTPCLYRVVDFNDTPSGDTVITDNRYATIDTTRTDRSHSDRYDIHILQTLTVPQLKELCKQRHVVQKGKKQELIARLQASQSDKDAAATL